MTAQNVYTYPRSRDGVEALRLCIRRNSINRGCYTAVYLSPSDEIVATAVERAKDAPAMIAGAPLVGLFDETVDKPTLRGSVL